MFCLLYVSARRLSSLHALPLPLQGLFASIEEEESPEAALEKCKSEEQPLECLVGLETALYCELWEMRDPQRTDFQSPADCFAISFVFTRHRALLESASREHPDQDPPPIVPEHAIDASFTDPEVFTSVYTAALAQLIVHHRYLRALRRVSLHLPPLSETCSSLWNQADDVELMQQTCLSLRVPLDSVEEQVRAVRCCLGVLGSAVRAQQHNARLDTNQLYLTTNQAWTRYDQALQHAILFPRVPRESMVFSVENHERLFKAWDAHFETMPQDFTEKNVFMLLSNVIDPSNVSRDVAQRIAFLLPRLDLSKEEYPRGFQLHVEGVDESFEYGEQGARRTVYDGQVHTKVPITVIGETVQGTRMFYLYSGRGILVDDAGYGIPTKIWSGRFEWNGEKTTFTLHDGLFLDYSPDTDVRMVKADKFLDEKPYGSCSIWNSGHIYDSYCDGSTDVDPASQVSFV